MDYNKVYVLKNGYQCFIRLNDFSRILKIFLYQNHCYYSYNYNAIRYLYKNQSLLFNKKTFKNILMSIRDTIIYNYEIYIDCYGTIDNAFVWKDTKEGADFWKSKSSAFLKLTNTLVTNKHNIKYIKIDEYTKFK